MCVCFCPYRTALTRVLLPYSAIQVPVVFEEVSLRSDDTDLKNRVKDAILSLKRNGVGLKGIVSTPVGPMSGPSINVQLRYACFSICAAPVGPTLGIFSVSDFFHRIPLPVGFLHTYSHPAQR